METPRINGERIRRYLSEGKRFDGRKMDEFRNIQIELGISKKAEGSARVRIGKTEVIVGIKMDVGEPYPDSQDKGNLVTSAELLPLSSPRIELGKPGFDSIEMGRIIDRCIRESKFINFEKLCIKEGEKVWNVFVDIYSINDDGNLLDAAGIAAIAALKSAKMPGYNEATGKADYEKHAGKIPLSDDFPISITFHKIGDNFIVDPTREEEDFSETRVTIGSLKGTIASMQKGETEVITFEDLSKLLELVGKVYKDVAKEVEKQVK
ncbi:Exosome complex component Rrp42 [uncultured archaeon]|nr:Exosome complex component Rrp42 [uncultured archaeon]